MPRNKVARRRDRQSPHLHAAKSMRLDGQHGSIVAVWFMAKGPSKSAVGVQHTRLQDRDAANRFKEYWAERLDALAAVLS